MSDVINKMEFGNGLDAPIFHGIHFSSEELSVLREALDCYDKSLEIKISRWSNPVYNPASDLVNEDDFKAYEDRALRSLKPETKKREVIKKLHSKI